MYAFPWTEVNSCWSVKLKKPQHISDLPGMACTEKWRSGLFETTNWTHQGFVLTSSAAMYSKEMYLFICIVTLLTTSLQAKTIERTFLRLSHLTTCTYDYEVSVHTARGAQSTASDGYQVHALVTYNLFALSRNKYWNFSMQVSCQYLKSGIICYGTVKSRVISPAGY